MCGKEQSIDGWKGEQETLKTGKPKRTEALFGKNESGSTTKDFLRT